MATAAEPGVDPRGPSLSETLRADQVASLPWVEKYRPKEMSDLISHDEIISTMSRYCTHGLLAAASAFRTSTILVLDAGFHLSPTAFCLGS